MNKRTRRRGEKFCCFTGTVAINQVPGTEKKIKPIDNIFLPQKIITVLSSQKYIGDPESGIRVSGSRSRCQKEPDPVSPELILISVDHQYHPRLFIAAIN
jgi:hypothetical protein